MKTPKELAKALLKVGLLGFGGGIGMLAILRAECVKKRKLVTDDDLCTAVAMGQMLPGPFIPNYCEYIGSRLEETLICYRFFIVLNLKYSFSSAGQSSVSFLLFFYRI